MSASNDGMNKLFLHHHYLDLPTRDVSGNGNNGAS
jgi:hypothetical protein